MGLIFSLLSAVSKEHVFIPIWIFPTHIFQKLFSTNSRQHVPTTFSDKISQLHSPTRFCDINVFQQHVPILILPNKSFRSYYVPTACFPNNLFFPILIFPNKYFWILKQELPNHNSPTALIIFLFFVVSCLVEEGNEETQMMTRTRLGGRGPRTYQVQHCNITQEQGRRYW